MTNNKVALVTGGAQGIGFKIAERLVEDGFKVAVVDFNEEGAKAAAKLSSDGTKAIAIKADVSNRDDVFNAVRQTAAQFGDFHVMVNNAGLGPTTPIDTITEEQFKTVYGVNVAGVLWGIQAAHEQFKNSIMAVKLSMQHLKQALRVTQACLYIAVQNSQCEV